MAIFDSMDSMDSMDAPDPPDAGARGAAGAASREFAVLVDRSRAATVNLAWLARNADDASHLLTPRGVVDGQLPRPGAALTPRHHEARVRASLYDFELQSALVFTADSHETARLRYRLPGAREPVPLVQITRPKLEAFRRQALYVEELAQLRGERRDEILAELTPPYPLWIAVADLSVQRTPRTLELIDCGMRLTSSVVQQFKHQFACPRPIEYSPLIQPVIQTPGHRSYPSGHATQAFFVARLLQLLASRRCPAAMVEQLQAQAARVAQNREVAGVHFPVDSAAGRLLGDTLACHVAALGGGGSWSGAGRHFDGTRSFDPATQVPLEAWPDTPAGTALLKTRPPSAVAWLWQEAVLEWQA